MAEVASLTIQLDDAFSAGADAATSAAEKLAAGMDKVTASSQTQDTVIRTRGQTFDSIEKKYDGNAAALARLEAIEKRYQAAVQITTSTLTAQGASATDIADRIARLGNVRDAEATKAVAYGKQVEAVATGTKSMGDAADKASGHMKGLGEGTSGATRELIVLGHEAISGNWNRLPGSLMVLAERGNGVKEVFIGLASYAASLGGALTIVGAVATAAVLGLGYIAESENRRIVGLRQEMSATHDDYEAMAVKVEAASKRVAATTSASISDARIAASTIASAAYFKGTEDDIVNLTTTILKMAKVLKEDIPAASREMKTALDDPAKFAQSLAERNLLGMTQGLANYVAQVQKAQSPSDALNAVLGIIRGRLTAGEEVTPLQKAIKNLTDHLYLAKDGGHSLSMQLGTLATDFAAVAVNGVDKLITSLENMEKKVQTTGALRNLVTSLGNQSLSFNENGTSVNVTGGTSTSQQVLLGPVIAGRTERAAGLFQVLPSTGRDMGYDVNDPTQNVAAGMTYLNQLYNKKGLDAALTQYGGYGTNVTKAQGYISNVLGTSSSSLPTSVSGQIEYWGNKLGMSPGMIEIGKQLVVVESGGKQYSTGPTTFGRGGESYLGALPTDATLAPITNATTSPGPVTVSTVSPVTIATPSSVTVATSPAAAVATTSSTPITISPSSATTAAVSVTPTIATPSSATTVAASSSPLLGGTTSAPISATIVTPGMIEDAKKLNDEEAKRNQLTIEFKQIDLQSEIDKLSARMVEAAKTTGTGTAEYRMQWEQLDKLKAAQHNTVTEMTAAQRASESSLRGTAGQVAADQALSAALETRNQISLRSRGVAMSAAEAEQVRTNVLKAQEQQLGRTEGELARTTANSTLMAAAYDKGNQAVIDATAEQSAYNKALELFGTNIPQGKLDELTAFYKNQAKAAGEAKIAQTNLQSRDSIAYIEEETSTLGMNEDQRTKLLAVMKAEQAMHAQFGIDLPKRAQDYVTLAGNIADATSAYQHQQAVTSELSSFFTSTFDTIGNAITSAFATGEISALKFKDLAKSVASAVLSEFVKLAVLNPLKSFLFGSTNSTVTLSDFLSFLGGGTTSSVGAGSGGSGVTAAAALLGGASAFSGGGSTITNSGDNISSNVTTSGGGALGAVSSVASIASTGDKLGLFGGGGEGIVSRVSDKVATFITDQIGNTGIANDIAANALGEGGDIAGSALGDTGGTISGLARVAASVSQSLGASTETAGEIASAAGAIGDALPYIGIAISVATDLIRGNYVKAGTTTAGALAGAAIGTWVFPGLGTAAGAAIGAVAGDLLGSFLGGHAKNSYQGTEVMVNNGQVVAGKTVAQIQSSDDAVKSINDFGSALDGYMSAVGVQLTNLNGTLGDVGQGIKGMTQYASVTDPAIFSKLQFAGNPADTSNFGVAKGALVDMQFNSITDLNNEVIKIAGFAAAVDAVGIQLKHVAKDISAIQIAGVSGGNANAMASVTDATGNIVQYHNDLRTALNSDLPGQTFADTTALDTEINKVNTFVNQTLPQLLTPIEKTSSSITDAVANIDKTYSDAIQQSLQYGLDNTAVLQKAEADAIAIVRRTALMSLTQDYTSIVNRFIVATNDNLYTQQQATLDALRATQANEIETFTKSWTDIFGDGVKSSAAFQASMQGLSNTLGAEFTAKVNATNKAIQAAQTSLYQTMVGYYARDAAANGNQQGSDLLNADVKAAQERQSFIDSFDATYGQLAESSQYFQENLVFIDKVHAEERLAIEKKYATDSTTATADTFKQAQGNVTALFSSLKSYMNSLQTGSESPLSPTAQYALASSQFDAVAGAAKAGDYSSASQLQSYAQNLQSASRAVNGSGVQYATDVGRILDAISGTAANVDTLTLSAQAALIREQTQAQVDAAQKTTDAVAALQDEVKALRREMQQQARAA